MGDKKAKGMDELVNYKPARVMYARPSEQWREKHSKLYCQADWS